MSIRRGLLLVTLLMAACSREPPVDPAVMASVTAFKDSRGKFDEQVQAWIAEQSGDQRDFRGRTPRQDLTRWVKTPEYRASVDALVARALDSRYPADAQQSLKQAYSELDAASERRKAIMNYWKDHLPAPYWRRYWQSLYEANDAKAEPPDPMLVGIEKRMTASLDKGDFAAASRDADELLPALVAARERVVNSFIKERRYSATLQPRKTPCVRGTPASGGNERAKFTRGESIDKFYPAAAINAGEQGAVIMRARIDAVGCARAVAIVAHSGIPSLDAAALRWFETAQFSPGTERGVPIESDLIWKVRFVLKD